MSRAVWKFPLTAPNQLLSVQEPGVVRHVHWQHDTPTVWIEVDPDDSRGTRQRRFEVVATGERWDKPTGPLGYVYHGTAHDLDNGHVWHVYEIVLPPQSLQEGAP